MMDQTGMATMKGQAPFEALLGMFTDKDGSRLEAIVTTNMVSPEFELLAMLEMVGLLKPAQDADESVSPSDEHPDLLVGIWELTPLGVRVYEALQPANAWRGPIPTYTRKPGKSQGGRDATAEGQDTQ